jgi:hypothetical protein
VVNENPQQFTDETMQSLEDLGSVFRRIHNRLMSEGWILKDGKLIPPPDCIPPK